MVVGGLLAGVAGGALGGGLAVTVLAPLTAANNFLGSYFFGSGMILGERQMYQDDWIKIKKRLDAGESFLVVLEEVMKPNTQAIMQMARETVIAVSAEWNKIVLSYLGSLSEELLNAIGLEGLTKTPGEIEYQDYLDDAGITDTTTTTTTANTESEILAKAQAMTRVQIAKYLVELDRQGVSKAIQAKVLLIYHSKKVTKTLAEIEADKKAVQDEINKNKLNDPLMVQYITFLNLIVSHNQILRKYENQVKLSTGTAKTKWSKLIVLRTNLKATTIKNFNVWKKNNARWLSVNNLS